MGILVNGKDPREVQKEVDAGLHDDKILGRVELHIDRDTLKRRQVELLKIIEEKHKVEDRASRLIRREVRPALRAFGYDVVPMARRRPLARVEAPKK